MTQKQNQWIKIMMGVFLVIGMLILAKLAAMMTDARRTASLSEGNIGGQTGILQETESEETILSGNTAREREPGQECIIIDPGHGGADPGKVGINGALEKDINLQMAYILKEQLEAEGFYVILTRTSDELPGSENGDITKVQDLQNRIRLIAEENPLMVISIHQNSYPQESVRGAQVFYYETSEEGRQLAECIQRQLILAANDGNHRQIKGNTSYFLLKKTPVTTVIVECGFLSNWQEATLLQQEDYQRLMTGAIVDGILEYLGRESSVSENEPAE
ncbi:MAG: N-acetylmuramoyl-L-alanine amidase [Lachnospiraceae bacterium]|nr:N-acetylmuramoyl-L-alanine amidase [Lachnospiraceae bacterium]